MCSFTRLGHRAESGFSYFEHYNLAKYPLVINIFSFFFCILLTLIYMTFANREETTVPHMLLTWLTRIVLRLSLQTVLSLYFCVGTSISVIGQSIKIYCEVYEQKRSQGNYRYGISQVQSPPPGLGSQTVLALFGGLV